MAAAIVSPGTAVCWAWPASIALAATAGALRTPRFLSHAARQLVPEPRRKTARAGPPQRGRGLVLREQNQRGLGLLVVEGPLQGRKVGPGLRSRTTSRSSAGRLVGFRKCRMVVELRVRLVFVVSQAVLRCSWISPARMSWRWIRCAAKGMMSGASAGAMWDRPGSRSSEASAIPRGAPLGMVVPSTSMAACRCVGTGGS
jgi:hypothetical protein